MIDRFLSKTGVGIALLLMVTELSYVNTLSLEYMFNTQNISATIFGIIGAIAFSSVTVLIMRLGKQNWAKIAFPLFDMLLTFCGLNLEHADHLFANPIRFAMSIILSVFAGLNTYSLGLINADQHAESTKNETNTKQIELIRRIDESENKCAEQQRIINELTAKQNDWKRIADESKRKADESIMLLAETKTNANHFLRNHILYEAWMSKKRSETNRNGFDKAVNEMAERLKQGVTITIDEYIKLNKA